MATALPEIKHIYQNYVLDSTRWNKFKSRDGDIIIATSIKSGTTWMQNIVMHLIFQDLEQRVIGEMSPFLELRLPNADAMFALLETQRHRRFIKTHLPLDGLPYHHNVKYIVVGRDARDVFMSLWNHHRNITREFSDALNNLEGRVGDPGPECPDDIRDFWHMWITRGWFEWENEGYPFWSNMRHVQTWWDFRQLPNILFVHYNDLLADLENELRRIAKYLDIELSDELLSKIADAVTFSTMQQKAEQVMGDVSGIWNGGAKTFMHKGTNGRWRDVLTEDDLLLYDDAVKRNLSPDCAFWLENGAVNSHSSELIQKIV
jgi:aryl sulfotransferase